MHSQAKLGVLLLIILSALAAWGQSQAPPGSLIANTAYVSYVDDNGKPINNIPSNLVLVTVASVTAGQLLQSQNVTYVPGAAVLLQHHLNNVGNTTTTYYVGVNGQPGSDYAVAGLAIYLDANNNGRVDTGEVTLNPTSPVQLTPGQSVSLLVTGTVPNSAVNGQKAILQVSASDLADAALTNTDVITVGPGGVVGGKANVALQKSASVSSATAGQTVQFTLQAANFGTGAASGNPLTVDGATQSALYVLDEIPANTHFVSIASAVGGTVFYHSLGAPSGAFTATAPAGANIDYVGFAVPELAPGQSYTFGFNVRVDDNASGDISNIASVVYSDQNQNLQNQLVLSNTVLVTVPTVPPTIAYYTDSTFSQLATVTTINGTIHLQAMAAACNSDPTVAEKHLITIATNQTHDMEQFMAVESGPNTGVFQVQNVALADGNAVPIVQGDGTLEVYKNETLTATITGCGTSISAIATIAVDPYGVLFDSLTDQLISGVQVTLIDVTGQGNGGNPGQPAKVLQADYKTAAPSTVTTGSNGVYQFPLVAPSTYKLTIVPSNGYKFPSAVAAAKLPKERVILLPASYGGNFQITATSGTINFDVPLDPGPLAGLFIQKSADQTNVESGSLVGYTVEVKNNTGQALPNTTVVDTMPSGFLYQPHSATMGGKAMADPAGGRGPVLTFSIGAMPINGDVLIHYFVRLLPQANSNAAINTAYAASGVTRSNTAQAKVKIVGGVFDTKGVIVGKVFADCNGNRVQDADEPGVPGVRIYLDNGTFAVTDEAGKYSIFGVTARLHGLKMDSYTLPEGFAPSELSTRNAGDGGSQFVDMISGELHRADFALHGCTPEAMRTLAGRTKTSSASEATALMKKAPLLDRANQSMEERRGAPVSAILGGPAAKEGMDAAVVSGGGNAATVAVVPQTGGQGAAEQAPAAGSGLKTVAESVEAPAPAKLTALVEAKKSADEMPQTQNGLRVVKLITTEMNNDFGFVGLHDGQVVGSTQVDVALKGMLGTEFELSVNGQKIPSDRVGQRSVEVSVKLQAWLYIGMELHPGRNRLEAKMYDPFGNVRGSHEIWVTAPGALAAVVAELGTRSPVADGKTPLAVSVRLTDAAGVPVTSRTPVTLETTAGRWAVEDLNPKEPGTQVFIEGGRAEFTLTPPMEPTEGKITVSSGTLLSENKVSFIPELRPLMAIGVVEETLSFRRYSGSGGQSASFYTLESEVNRLGLSNDSGSINYASHIGALLKGRVWGDTLMTLSYDSDKQSGDPMFRDSQSDDYFLVYGDSSTRGYEAQSTSRLYVRLDRGKNYVMYGDYNTADRQNTAKVLSNVNRSFTGFRMHQELGHVEYTAYSTRDNARQLVEEIPGNGSSGPYLVSHIDLLLNSETVEILVRDRNQPAVILQSTTQAVMSDYQFDGLTGAIIFKQPIPSHDGAMNPVSIRVTYEFTSGGPKYWMSGVDGSLRIQKLRMGGTFYDDKTPAAGLRLWGTNGSYAFSKDATVAGEYAHTWTPLLGDGNGVHAEFKQKNTKLDSRVYFGRTDASFDNPNAMLNKGRGESGANITWKLDKHLRLHFELIRSEATDTGVSQMGIYTTVQRDIGKLITSEFGYRHAGSQSTPAGTSGSAATSTAANDDLYAKMSAKIPKFKQAAVYGEYEDDMASFSKRMFAVGGTYQFSEKGKFYVRHELISSLGNLYQLNGAQQQNATVFGIDTTYLKNEHIFSEYRGTDAFSGRETEAAIGLRNVFSLRPGLRLSTTAEDVKTLTGTSNNDALALTGAVEYTASAKWKSSGRFEWRQSSSSDAILSSVGLALKLSDSYTLLNRSIYSLTIPKSAGQTDRLQVRIQNGISFRPTHSNRTTVLSMVELKEEKDGTSTVMIPDRKVAILTLAATHQPTSKLVVSARYATKWSNDVTSVVDSTMDGHMTTTRVSYDLHRNWTVGVGSSELFSNHFHNIEYAHGVEFGRVLGKNLWLSLGYNLTGFYDRDLGGEDATRRGPYVRMRFKFDESLFPFLKVDGRQK